MNSAASSLNKQLATPPLPKLETSKAERAKDLLAKVRTYRENIVANRGAVVEGSPDKIYCWVNQREERQLFFQSMGWGLVNDPNVKTAHRQADNTHKRADLLLYEIDRDLYDVMEADKQLRAIEAIDGAESAFDSFVERNGAPKYKPRV